MIVYFVFWDKKRVAVFHVVNGGLTMTPKRRSSNLREYFRNIFWQRKNTGGFFYGYVRCKYAIFFLFASCINESKNKTVKKLSGLLCPHLSLWEKIFFVSSRHSHFQSMFASMWDFFHRRGGGSKPRGVIDGGGNPHRTVKFA
jgi:hypothetical protein